MPSLPKTSASRQDNLSHHIGPTGFCSFNRIAVGERGGYRNVSSRPQKGHVLRRQYVDAVDDRSQLRDVLIGQSWAGGSGSLTRLRETGFPCHTEISSNVGSVHVVVPYDPLRGNGVGDRGAAPMTAFERNPARRAYAPASETSDGTAGIVCVDCSRTERRRVHQPCGSRVVTCRTS